MSGKRRLLIPCSGIGKAVGEVAREATRLLMEELRPGTFETVCLPLIMTDDEGDTGELVRSSEVFAIDGCPKKCATASVKHAGGEVDHGVLVVRVLAKNRSHRPESIVDIGEGGRQLARDVAMTLIEEGGV